MKKISYLIALSMLGATGCSFIELKPEAEFVNVASDEMVTHCKPVGTATTKVLDSVLFFPRTEQTMATELDMLASNEAIKFGGNTIVPISDIADGSRSYRVYHCNKDTGNHQ